MEDALNDDFFTMSKAAVSKQLFTEINWHEILRAGVFLTAKDHQFLGRAQDDLQAVVDSSADCKAFAKLLLKIADNCTSNIPVQQYVFTRVEEMLAPTEASPAVRAAACFTADGETLIDAPFVRALHSPDAYCRFSASTALAYLLANTTGDYKTFCMWIGEQLDNGGNFEQVLPVLAILMRRPSARTALQDNGGVKLITQALTNLGPNGNAQFIYELCFVLWTFTLSDATASRGGSELNFAKGTAAGMVNFNFKVFLAAGTVPLLSELIAAAPSRKVVRMCVATLRNLALLGVDEVLTEMLNVGIDRQMESFINNNSHKQGGDVEVEADSKQLQEILLRNYRDLSTFDKWKSEVASGALRWGIVHTEKFWRENARLMEADDFAPVKKIIGYLRSDSSVAVAIALYDLGEFTRFYPNGRQVTKSLGGKDLAMSLIDHDNPDVRRQALQCVSKVMITNWDYMK